MKLIRRIVVAAILACAWNVHGAGIVAAWSVEAIPTDKAPKIRLVGKEKTALATVRADLVAALRDVLAKIQSQAGLTTEFYIVKYDDNRINAFASAQNGRNIVGVTPELLQLMADDLDIYAAIFGHEIAHIARQHGSNRTARRGVLNAVGTVLGIIVGSRIGINPGSFGAQLVDSAFSRDEEREADKLGFDYMVAAGFDPMGAVRAQEKLLSARSGGAPMPILSTHPGGEERVETFRQMAAGLPPRERTLLRPRIDKPLPAPILPEGIQPPPDSPPVQASGATD